MLNNQNYNWYILSKILDTCLYIYISFFALIFFTYLTESQI